MAMRCLRSLILARLAAPTALRAPSVPSVAFSVPSARLQDCHDVLAASYCMHFADENERRGRMLGLMMLGADRGAEKALLARGYANYLNSTLTLDALDPIPGSRVAYLSAEAWHERDAVVDSMTVLIGVDRIQDADGALRHSFPGRVAVKKFPLEIIETGGGNTIARKKMYGPYT